MARAPASPVRNNSETWVKDIRFQNQIDGLAARLSVLEGNGFVFDSGTTTATLAAATTAVSVAGLLATDIVALAPANANAASLDGWAYVSTVATGTFTYTHDNSALTRTYKWFAIRQP